MARILTALEAPMWRLVRELYLLDKVVEALHEAERLGGQDSNDLYAEAQAREKGEQIALRPWLKLEAIRAEIGDALPTAENIIGTECEALSRRFGWDNHETVLVTLLPQDVEEPWMPGRWGYFVDKVPYDKICLPYHLAFDPPNLTRTIQHEFMHQITLNLSGGHAPRWLEEALSTYAEGRPTAAAWNAFKSGEWTWLLAGDVNLEISRDNRDGHHLQAISRAYAQANLVAHFLVAKDGEEKVGLLLRAIGDESLTHSLGEIMGRSKTDSALRDVYKLSEREVFETAFDWIRSTRAPG